MLFIYFSSLPAEKSKNIEMEKSRKEELYVNKHAIRRVFWWCSILISDWLVYIGSKDRLLLDVPSTLSWSSILSNQKSIEQINEPVLAQVQSHSKQ